MSLRADFMAQKRLDEEEKETKTISQLKADNKHLNELLKQALKDYDRTLKTLAEIKEIAENNKHSFLCFTAFESDTIEVNNEPMATILQKIKECEVDNDL